MTTVLQGPQLARLLGRWQGGRNVPDYAALAATVRGLLSDGRLPLGVRLPAERELALALGISRTTVSAAYRTLRETGHLTSRRGAGSWTSPVIVMAIVRSPVSAQDARPPHNRRAWTNRRSGRHASI